MKKIDLITKTGLGLLIMLLSGSYSQITACTGIFYGNGKIALAGNNEDWKNPFTRVWIIPAEGNKFGRVCFGFNEGGSQGGMNDQGLFYDGFALAPATVSSSAQKDTYPGDLVQKAIEECRSVDEVIALFERYDRQFLAGVQFFFADRQGHSAIIEAGAIIRKQGDFQIVTNFRQSAVVPSAITDQRYLIARNMMESQKKIDVELIRRILAHTHQEGQYPTQYSNICDLKNGIIYLYSFHNYEEVFRLNLKEELARGRRTIDLKSLFSESYAAESYQKLMKKQMAERLEKEKIVPVKSEVIGRLSGKYDIGAGSLANYTVVVSHHDSKLFAEMSFLEKTELLPVSDTDYIMIGLEETVKFRFILDENGKAIQLAVTMYGEETLATKKL